MTSESLLSLYRRLQTENRSAWLQELSAAVMVTTVCDRKCPLCCYKDVVRSGHAKHFDKEHILAEIAALDKVGRIGLMGGEPTLHPDIEEIIERARELRGDKVLNLITNGKRLLQIADVTKHLSAVYLSVYEAGVEESAVSVAYQRVKAPDVTLCSWVPVHVDYTGKSFPCSALQDSVAVMDGRVYPCCGSVGVADACSTELSPGWEKRLLYVEAPCERCQAAV